MAALEAGVPLSDVQIAAHQPDPRTTVGYDHRRANFDKHAAYVGVAFVDEETRDAVSFGDSRPQEVASPAFGRLRDGAPAQYGRAFWGGAS